MGQLTKIGWSSFVVLFGFPSGPSLSTLCVSVSPKLDWSEMCSSFRSFSCYRNIFWIRNVWITEYLHTLKEVLLQMWCGTSVWGKDGTMGKPNWVSCCIPGWVGLPGLNRVNGCVEQYQLVVQYWTLVQYCLASWYNTVCTIYVAQPC